MAHERPTKSVNGSGRTGWLRRARVSSAAAALGWAGWLGRWRARRTRRLPVAGDWRRVLRPRVLLGAITITIWAIAIEARLIHLQVIQHDDLIARAERQQLRTVDAHPKRGELLDRAGRVLAYSVDADTIYAVAADMEQPERIAALLCEALAGCDGEEQRALEGRLRQRRPFAYIRRRVTPEEARRVAALYLEGVGFLKENRRYYPNRELAAHLLGYVGVDNQGLSGIESTYDAEIRGRAGKILIQTDARRRAFSRIERPPTAGATIELTIDKYLQHIAERELRAAVTEHRAAGGSVVMLDPHTGEILALANEPTFNPNVFAEFDASIRRNRALQEVYEPGSAFKVVTASAALEEGVVRLEELIDVSAGAIEFGTRRIPDTHPYGVLSFTDVIVKSSNVGAIKVGLRLGPERLGRYIRRFGFGGTLARDFQGESPGIVWNPARLDDSALASVAMGYQISVTPLQMAAAVSAVANGGELVEPRLVRAVLRNGVRAEAPRRVIRRAIGPDTAAQLTAIMEAVVERGTARAARLAEHTVAGKTGTSEKLVNGAYSSTDHNASFIGFVPSRNPVLTMMVVIDTPRVKGYFGGAVAAPVFKRIAEAALRHLGVAPTIDPEPPVLVARAPGTRPSAQGATVLTPAVLAAAQFASSAEGLMPELTGISAREAVDTLAHIGLTTRLLGSGFVVNQTPAPGTPIERGEEAVLWLERRLLAPAEIASTP